MNSPAPSVHRSLAISIAERYALIALALASSIIVARLLTPEEIGIYTIATALIGIAQVVRDFGIGSYLVQEKNLTDEHVRSAFGVSLALGGVLFAVFIVGAPWAGLFYQDSRIVGIVRIIAFNFLLLPFCSISLSLLRRSMKFGPIMAANTTGAVLGAAVLLSLAWGGFGPASLAWGSLAANAGTGLVAWLARPERRMLRPGFAHVRTIFRFGGQSTIAAVVTSIAMDVNDLIVGKVMGFSAVAMLSRAQGLMNLFHRDIMTAIRGVAFPAFAQAHREGAAMDQKYNTTVANVTLFAWPFYGLSALFPLEIMRLLFGPQWDAAASLVPIFCLAGAVAATFNLINPWMIAIGRNDLVTRAELIVQPLRVALVALAAYVFRSLMACAIAFLIAFVIAAPIFYLFKQNAQRGDVRALCANLWRSAQVTVVSLLVPLAIALKFDLGRAEPIPLPFLACAVLSAAFAWLAAVHLLRHPIRNDALFRRVAGMLSARR